MMDETETTANARAHRELVGSSHALIWQVKLRSSTSSSSSSEKCLTGRLGAVGFLTEQPDVALPVTGRHFAPFDDETLLLLQL